MENCYIFVLFLEIFALENDWKKIIWKCTHLDIVVCNNCTWIIYHCYCNNSTWIYLPLLLLKFKFSWQIIFMHICTHMSVSLTLLPSPLPPRLPPPPLPLLFTQKLMYGCLHIVYAQMCAYIDITYRKCSAVFNHLLACQACKTSLSQRFWLVMYCMVFKNLS